MMTPAERKALTYIADHSEATAREAGTTDALAGRLAGVGLLRRSYPKAHDADLIFYTITDEGRTAISTCKERKTCTAPAKVIVRQAAGPGDEWPMCLRHARPYISRYRVELSNHRGWLVTYLDGKEYPKTWTRP